MSNQESVNTFTELNTDSHPVNTTPNVMVDAINATLTTKGKNQLILQNMEGNENIANLTEGFQPLGVGVFRGISYILSGNFDDDGNFIEGELGTYPSPAWSDLMSGGLDSEYYLPIKQEYAPLHNFSTLPSNNVNLDSDDFYKFPFRTEKLNFRTGKIIEVELQPSYDGSVNIIFTDAFNPVRLVNSRFKVSDDGKRAAIADRRQNKDTNTYAESRFGSTKLIRQSDEILDLVYNGLKSGGATKGGGYRFYFKYIDSDGSLTDIIEESRLVSIAYSDHGATEDNDTGNSISFTLNNLDQKFSGIKLYYSRATGTVDTTTVIYEVNNIYDLPSTGNTMDLIFYGNEDNTEISFVDLNIDYSSINTVKTISQHDDRLVLGNITDSTQNYDEFRKISQGLRITELNEDMAIKDLGSGYADPDNIYYKLGHWSGETYEIAIIYILTEGRGNTPAFPVRGGDNYSTPYDNSNPAANQFSYTGYGEITSSDGYVAGSTENRLGVYRTNKRKVLLKGDGNITEVRKLHINIEWIKNSPLIQEETSGFFFVRRERKRDALVQGYSCNTCEIPVLSDEKSSANMRVDSRVGIGIDREGGSNPYKDSVKVVPSPGRIWEANLIKIGSGSNIQHANGGIIPSIYSPLSMQGIVFPDPNPAAGSTKKMNYSFYTPDGLVNPAYISSIFNGSNKGMAVNGLGGDVVVGHQELIDHTVTTNPPGSTGYPIEYTGTFQTPSSQVQVGQLPANAGTFNLLDDFNTTESVANQDLNFTINAQLTSAATNWGTGTVRQYSFTGVNNAGFNADVYEELESSLKITLTVDSNGLLVPGSSGITGVSLDTSYHQYSDVVNPINPNTPSNSGPPQYKYLMCFGQNLTTNQYLGRSFGNSSLFRELSTVLSADFTPINGVGQSNSATFTLKVRLNIYGYYANTGSGMWSNASGSVLNHVTEEYEISGNWFMSTEQKDLNNNLYNINATSIKPIQDITVDNFVFDPETVNLSAGESVNATYVPTGQNSYSNGQFSALSDKNIHYYLNSNQGNNGIDIPILNPGSNNNVNASALYADQISFSDYIGIRISRPETLLTNPLRNDNHNVRNTNSNVSNGYGVTGSDIGDWTYKVDDEGFRLGVVTNIYASSAGPQTVNDWKNKYSSSSYIDPYFAISKRMSWSEVNTNSIDGVDLFDGDCYVNYSYKRLNYSMGIEGAPEATNPLDYEFYDRPGLSDRGTVMPLVCEGNYNTSLRTFDFKSGVEKGLYGKDRTFFPIDTIEMLRGTRQPESKGYNFGYNYGFSDRNYTSLNDRAPSLDIKYGNRIMVSSPAIAGNFSNGYTDFSGLNFRDYNRQLGEITRVIAHNNDLFCIFEKGIGTVPMNQRTMLGDGSEGIVVDDAKILANKMKVISTEYGSDQQFSIIKTDEFVYGVDLNKTKMWRIVGQGGQHSIELISDFAVQSILNEYKERLESNDLNDVVKCNYDRERNNVVVSFLSEYNGNYSTDFFSINSAEEPLTPDDDLSTLRTVSGNNESSTPTLKKGLGGGDIELPDTNINIVYTVNSGDVINLQYRNPGDTNTYNINNLPSNYYDNGSFITGVAEIITDGVDIIHYITAVNGSSTGYITINVIAPDAEQVNNYESVLSLKNNLGSLYYNETINKWVSRLSWNPLFMFNLGSNLYSFNATDNTDKVWKHFSENVPYCNFYGNQDKFEFEFIVVGNSSAQKILNNMQFICNRSFPGRITYNIDEESDFETSNTSNGSYTELMRQRHEFINKAVGQSVFGNLCLDLDISKEEAERIVGSHFEYNNNFYIIGSTLTINNINYVTLLTSTGSNITSIIPGLFIGTLNYGIIQQNMEYKQNELYIEVGKGFDKSRIRDKAIKVRVVYEGKDYVTLQSIISQFVYSFN